jgi:hypothetical protein
MPVGRHEARAADPRWVEAERMSPFVYRSDFHLGERDGLLRELRQLQTDLATALGLPPSSETIELYLFRDEASYREYLEERFGDLPRRRALYIKTTAGPGMVYAYRGEQFAIDLRHETTHALLHAVLTEVPLWLDEGLAEYFEVTRDQRSDGHQHLSEIQQRLRQSGVPRLESLERLEDVTALDRNSYIDAWAWVHFLQHGPPAVRAELAAYVRELNQPRTLMPLSTRLRRALPQLEQAFAAHFDRLTVAAK